jgi:hypothetical protein
MSIVSVACVCTRNECNSLIKNQNLANRSYDKNVDVKCNYLSWSDFFSSINILLVHAKLIDTNWNLEYIYQRKPNGVKLLECDTKVDMAYDRKHKNDQHV